MPLHLSNKISSLKSTKEKTVIKKMLLIEPYRLYPCLLYVKSDLYRDRNKRGQAINLICEEQQNSVCIATLIQVKKKIDISRSQ